jgi:hypothetical protein
MNIGSYAKGETLRNINNKPIPIRKFIENVPGPPQKMRNSISTKPLIQGVDDLRSLSVALFGFSTIYWISYIPCATVELETKE